METFLNGKNSVLSCGLILLIKVSVRNKDDDNDDDDVVQSM